jgi:hypothetical protein
LRPGRASRGHSGAPLSVGLAHLWRAAGAHAEHAGTLAHMPRRRTAVTFWGTNKARRNYAFQSPPEPRKAKPYKFVPVKPSLTRRKKKPKHYGDSPYGDA